MAEAIIRNLALFEGTSGQTVRQAALDSELRRACRGEIVLQRGLPVPGMFALAYGSLKTRLRNAQGDEVVLSLIGPGETLAEAPSLLVQPAKLDAVALADSMLVMIPAASLSALLQRDARLSRNLVTRLAERTQTLLAELESGLQRSSQRLAAYLESIVEPADRSGAWVARLPVSKTLLAARLGMKKETLSRLLRQLAARGLVSVAQREIRILDRAGLLEVSSDPAHGA